MGVDEVLIALCDCLISRSTRFGSLGGSCMCRLDLLLTAGQNVSCRAAGKAKPLEPRGPILPHLMLYVQPNVSAGPCPRPVGDLLVAFSLPSRLIPFLALRPPSLSSTVHKGHGL